MIRNYFLAVAVMPLSLLWLYAFHRGIHFTYVRFETVGFILSSLILAAIAIPGVYMTPRMAPELMLSTMLLIPTIVLWEIVCFYRGLHGWPWPVIVVRLIGDLFVMKGLIATHADACKEALAEGGEYAEFVKKTEAEKSRE